MSYRVVVRDPNSWSASTGEHCLIRECGHRHRTEAAAERCLRKLVDFNYRTSSSGSWCADWHNASVEEAGGEQ